MKFCFQTSAYDVSRLLPEVTDALDKRMEAIAKAPPQQVVFSDAGMLLRDGETVSYEAITFCAETTSGVLLNWADKATFLQKRIWQKGNGRILPPGCGKSGSADLFAGLDIPSLAC